MRSSSTRLLSRGRGAAHLEEARLGLAHGREEKTVTVEFCGPLREEAGSASESIRTSAATAAGL